MFRGPSLLLAALVSSLLVSVSGCASIETTPVDASERHTPTHSARMTFNIQPPPLGFFLGAPTEGASYSEFVRMSAGFDLEFDHVRGDDNQNVLAGQTVNLGSLPFAGPRTLEIDTRLKTGLFQARTGVIIAETLRIEGLAGIAVHDFDIEIESGALRDTEDIFGIGPMIGAKISGHPTEWLEVYGSARFSGTGLDGNYLTSLDQYEVGLAFGPIAHVTFLAGWRWSEFEAEGDDDDFTDIFFNTPDPSDIDFRYSGPMVAVRLDF